ncbi:MAG: 2-dehydro-3-deoxygalactonokinase [Pseudomonadota bacterium]|nr:2-dehydro-3-deoxygalactonokinase [Pseudomonadota bacterium]MED5366919.1 2-dehydro-3-deoxygalactonokinase [Pseudomonadota bacterium]
MNGAAAGMIAVDWGTSSLRAYHLDGAGRVHDRRAVAAGILTVKEGDFAGALAAVIGDWLADETDLPVYLSGMIGSRQGWVEAPYVPCPADLSRLVAGLTPVDVDGAGRRGWIAPGLTARNQFGEPDVMRGEEVQLLGLAVDPAAAAALTVCLPGSHSKWARIRGQTVDGFRTFMTGEVFAALRDHTILGRTMRTDGAMTAAFEDGVAAAKDDADWLHRLFTLRARGLFDELSEDDGAAFLSGLLIGYELAAVKVAPGDRVTVVGGDDLVALYGRALAVRGAEVRPGDPLAAARGLYVLAREHGDG